MRFAPAVALLAGMTLLAGCAAAVSGQAEAGGQASTAQPSASATGTADSTPTSATGEPVAAPGASTAAVSESALISTQLPPTQSPVPPKDPTTAPTTEAAVSTAASSSAAGASTAPSDNSAGGWTGDLPAAFDGARTMRAADFHGVVTDIGFSSPSGNINCGFFGADGVVCQITEYDYSIPPKPAECGDTGWGFNFGVDATGGGFMFCAGDVEGGGPKLAYGQQIVVGDYRCVSRESGITCVNTAVHGGFELARAGYTLY